MYAMDRPPATQKTGLPDGRQAGNARLLPRCRDLIESTPPTPAALRTGHPLDGVKVMLAPLCGISDSVFRRICLQHGADMVVTEMISSDGLIRNSNHIRAVRGLDMAEGPLSLQIFGSDPETMGEAAAILSRLEPRSIDMNFGCPVKKIVSRNGGSAVLKDPPLLHRICRRVVERSRVPVSAKIRSGWDKPTAANLAEIVHAIEDAGVSMITVHARTKRQGFKGAANWEMIEAIKGVASIPIVGNGDVMGPEDYFEIRDKTGCDAVMIGRGAIGNPWIFEEIQAATAGAAYVPPGHRVRIGVMLRHVRATVEQAGEPAGVISSRRVMAAYLKRLPNARELRRHIMMCDNLADLEALADAYLAATPDDADPVVTMGRAEFEPAC
jgi:nifR3 family TIM-barrel protein